MDGLAERLAAVRARIDRAAERVQRDPAKILLLAVTKIFPAEAIQEAYDLGLREFGENYVQEFEGKAPAVGGLPGARFHLIGHLQSNKAAKAAELFQVVQTVDSAKLARRLNDTGRALDVMLEVKLSEEEAKSGADAGRRSRVDRSRTSVPESAPSRPDDDAALVGRSGSAARIFPEAARTGRGQRPGRTVDGHVQRSGNGNRRRIDLRARGNRFIREAEERVTAGFFSPLPPARSGVADYSAALLAELRRHGRVEVAPAALRCGALPPGQQRPARGRLPPGHRRARAWWCMHDAVLNHFFLGQLNEAAYVDEFVYNYGEWNRALGRELWRCARGVGCRRTVLSLSDAEARGGTCARGGGSQSGGGRGGEGARRRCARVVEIPHLFAPPQLPDEAAVLRYRASLGVPPETFLFGVFGYLRESKRVAAVVESFARVHAEMPRAGLLIAGTVRFERPGTRDRRRCSKRPEYGACPIWRSANSGWRRAPWMPASICAIRRRARVPGSRFA